MFYYSWCKKKGRYLVGLATSPDGFKWTKKGVVFDAGAGGGDFDALGAAGHCVVRDVEGNQFAMFYEAVAKDGRRSIGMAVSKDGMQWQRSSEPVLTRSTEPGAWDGGSVGSPYAVSMSAGRWRLFYAGKPASDQGLTSDPYSCCNMVTIWSGV
jgi:hypothetical protein